MQTIIISRTTDTMFRAYRTNADRARAMAQFARHGYNYFVPYTDRGRPSLQAARGVDWVPAGTVHVDPAL